MANDEHLALLRQGVAVWNAWVNGELRWRDDLSDADLTGADLRRADLTGADLRRADLSRADLIRASLSGADLTGADLRRADLFGTNLTGADLTGANLCWGTNLCTAILRGANLSGADLRLADLTAADLSRADLRRANLLSTNLSGADLCGAILSEARLSHTILTAADLSATKGLDSCRHAGPSFIDHRTLERSGQLPLSFLRGVGLPDNLIDYLPGLLNQPIQFYSCFISYSSKDDEFAHRLHADLQNEGIRCWFAPEDLKIGDRIRTRIDEVIRLHEKLLLVLSQHSINSDWVQKEVETAFEKERESGVPVLFPIRLDDAVMESKSGWAADIKRTRHIGDFRNWKDHDAYLKGLQRFLRDLTIDERPVTRPT